MTGIKIPEVKEKVIISLFANDTLIYQNAKDDIKELQEIIKVFCIASKAKFNIEKTEYLPVGKKDYRKTLETTRKINDIPGNTIPDNINIIKEGQTMRTLGAWVGNGGNQNPQWKKILDKQKEIMDTWEKSRLSYRGKELILKALVQSRALFLATVNGMPKETQEKMQKQMRSFLWEGKRGKISWNKATKNRDEGGLGIPDIKIRTEAIQIMWMKQFLKDKRPKWAYVTDRIIAKNITRTPIVTEDNHINWITQSWHESEASWSKIPPYIREMLQVARKYNIGIEAIKISKKTKEQLPIWHHIASLDNYGWNKKAAKCLRKNHNIQTIKDLTNEIEIPDQKACQTTVRCQEMAQTLLNKIAPKYNPMNTTPRKDNLDHTPRRKKFNQKGDITETNKLTKVCSKVSEHSIKVCNEVTEGQPRQGRQ